MHTIIVSIQVLPIFIPSFIEITKYNAQNSRKEAGVVRFDFFQDAQDPVVFKLVEIYRAKEDQTAHQQTAHYLKWREAVAEMMAAPRTAQVLQSLDPSDKAWQ